MRSAREYAVMLLEKDSHDLIAGEATLATGKALDTVCFHAQQAAEKSLKSLLASRDVAYPFRHDLGELVRTAQHHFPDLSGMAQEISSLTVYAVEMRYDDLLNPNREEAVSALETARKAYMFAKQNLEL